MKIKIRRRTDLEKVIFGIFVIIFGEGILSIFVPQIHPLYYLTDLFNIILLVGLIKKRMQEKRINFYLRPFYLVITLYIVLTIIGVIVNYSNLALHLWSFRNYYTTLLFFVECVSFEHTDRIDFLDKLAWINFVVCLIEVALGYKQDWVGGIYGVSGGQVNGALNILLIITFSKFIVQYLNKEISTLNILIAGVTSLIIATFAELKIF